MAQLNFAMGSAKATFKTDTTTCKKKGRAGTFKKQTMSPARLEKRMPTSAFQRLSLHPHCEN